MKIMSVFFYPFTINDELNNIQHCNQQIFLKSPGTLSDI